VLQAKDRVWKFALYGLCAAMQSIWDWDEHNPEGQALQAKVDKVAELLAVHIRNREDNAPLFKTEGSGRAVEEALRVATEALLKFSETHPDPLQVLDHKYYL
jgi:hypothetical protein